MDKKRKHGPTQKPSEMIRKHHIGVYLTDAELAELARRAGTRIPEEMPGKKSGGDTASRRKIAAHIRAAAFGALPPKIPPANLKIWIELSPSLANLNQIAKKLNTGKEINDMDWLDIYEVSSKLTDLRSKLFEAES